METKPKAFFLVSAWNNDISWVKEYTDDYLIYDKSHTLERTGKVIQVENVGYNIGDICHFIVTHYESLPEFVAFLEGNPFDHCRKETFDKLIYNEKFTPIEDYAHVPESYAHKKDTDGGYMEINNSWYIKAHIDTWGEGVFNQKVHKLTSYNDFLSMMFENPEYPQWVRFSPGAQYIVPKENILFYTKSFYKKLYRLVNFTNIPAEAHIIERALYYIFTNKWKEKAI